MRDDLIELRKHVDKNKPTSSSSKKSAATDTSSIPTSKKAESKREKLLKLVSETEKEYQAKRLPSHVSQKIQAQFEQMKDGLKDITDLHQLKTKLQSELAQIKTLEKSAKDLEEEEEEKEEKEEEKEEEEEKDFEKADEDDSDF